LPQPAPELDDAEAPWADEETSRDSSGKGGFGPLGLVCAALILMIAVYLGATMLMKQ
jgi:serine/threonine-protein kinase